MAKQEIKSAFTFKYLALTLITTLLVSIVSVIVSNYLESKPSREFYVFNLADISLIEDSKLPKDEIEATYYLKSNPKREIQSLFRKVVSLQNVSTEGVENVRITVSVNEPDVFLLPNPRITTEPSEILNAVSVTKDQASTQSKHIWNVSLMNPKESIKFDYTAYSEKKHQKVLMTFIPRKKNWTVIEKPVLSSTEHDFWSGPVIIMISGFGLFALILLIYLGVLPFYIIQWNKRPDYIEKYGSFYRFYNVHRPWDLYKEPEQDESANNANAADAKSRTAD